MSLIWNQWLVTFLRNTFTRFSVQIFGIDIWSVISWVHFCLSTQTVPRCSSGLSSWTLVFSRQPGPQSPSVCQHDKLLIDDVIRQTDEGLLLRRFTFLFVRRQTTQWTWVWQDGVCCRSSASSVCSHLSACHGELTVRVDPCLETIQVDLTRAEFLHENLELIGSSSARRFWFLWTGPSGQI